MIGTIWSLLDLEAENIISAESIFGSVPNSSQKNTQRFLSLPPFSSATASISRYNCWMIREIMKKVFGFSSGIIMNSALFSLQNFSASSAVSKQRSCSSSESRNALSLDSAVLMTEDIACSGELSAAPANHLALWVSGSLSIRIWNCVLPLTPEGARSSWMILNTDMIWRSSGSTNSATSRIVAVRRPYLAWTDPSVDRCICCSNIGDYSAYNL